MARLPSILGTDDLPLAELCAARIDGELMALGTGWCPIDEPDLPSLRAAAIAPGDPLVIERRSAAWVHGGHPIPPSPAEYCVPYRERSTVHADPTRVVREVAIDDAEITLIGGVRCTTRLRTVLDLLRDPAADDAEVVAIVGRLIEPVPGAIDAVLARIGSAQRLPHKRVALERLRLVTAQPSLTR